MKIRLNVLCIFSAILCHMDDSTINCGGSITGILCMLSKAYVRLTFQFSGEYGFSEDPCDTLLHDLLFDFGPYFLIVFFKIIKRHA